MVSRVYTPLVTPYNRAQSAGGQRHGIPSATEEKPSFRYPAPPAETEKQPPAGAAAHDHQRPSGGLQAVQIDPNQRIPLDAVLQDFKSTMNALGADASTRAEVQAYLRVASLQGAKEQPEVPFIKHTLRTAAGVLDQFIGKALGQPSQVVKEWVDALLLQDIDYHTDQPLAEEPVVSHPAPANDAPVAETPPQPGFGKAEKSHLKALIDNAKAAHQAGQHAQADIKLQDALTLLTDQDQPALEGKVWHLRGRFAEKTGDWQKSVDAYEQAANRFVLANLPQKQSHALHAMAAVLEDHGQLVPARAAYRQVLSLEAEHGAPETHLRALNDLGSVSLRLGDTTDAIQHLESAVRLLPSAQPSPQAASDIRSNLAAAYRARQDFPNAITTYRHSLKDAKTARDKNRYARTLQQLAATYVEANQPDQAMQALQRLNTLQHN